MILFLNVSLLSVKNGKKDKMKPISIIRTDIPEKTVLFRHPAASFKVDSRIRYDAVYIKDPDLTSEKIALSFYKTELKRIENSEKSYIIMTYNPIISDYFSTLLSNPDSYDYKNWIFLAFFHEDNETLLLKHKKNIDILDLKAKILSSMEDHQFIQRFSLPLNHILTFNNILPILLESWGYKV